MQTNYELRFTGEKGAILALKELNAGKTELQKNQSASATAESYVLKTSSSAGADGIVKCGENVSLKVQAFRNGKPITDKDLFLAVKCFSDGEGSKEFKDARIKLIAQEIGDSTLVRVEHHWVEPKTKENLLTGLALSPNRYWTIHRLDKGEAVINAEFQYQKNKTYDGDLITSANDSIIILYRKDGSQKWQHIDFTVKGNNNVGLISVKNIQSGDYVLAVCNEEYTGMEESSNSSNINIYPNPVEDFIRLSVLSNQPSAVKIYNISGMMIEELTFDANEIEINVSDYNPGTYLIEFDNEIIKFVKK